MSRKRPTQWSHAPHASGNARLKQKQNTNTNKQAQTMCGIKKKNACSCGPRRTTSATLPGVPPAKESKPLRSHARTQQLAAAGGGRVKTQPKAADKRQQRDPARRRSLSEHGVGVPKRRKVCTSLIYTEHEPVVTGRWDA